jgi:BCD family chlorophyll transporter-like MFS transporter
VSGRGLGWPSIVRLGLVQSAIGAMVMLATSLLNRVMVVEYGLPAVIPGGLVAWHYGVQLSRPIWGHGSDSGKRRTPWIVGGMAVLAGGALLAIAALPLLGARHWGGLPLAILAFALIGAGVGAAGTSLLALLATRVVPERRAAAAAITWIMMVAGIAITAGVAGALIEPFSLPRLVRVASGVAVVAFLVSLFAVLGIERGTPPEVDGPRASTDFAAALRELWGDRDARRFTIFVFVSMLAYSMQDLILEPFSGLLFGFTPGESTQLSGVQHGGVLAGMVLTGVGGSAFAGRGARDLRRWIFGGCVGSGVALAGLAFAAHVGAGWPLRVNIFLLGFANGVFAVAAIGSMMQLAGAAGPHREGIRMGVWGASQAIAFGAGGLIGAVGVDLGRSVMGATDRAFALVFTGEALLFLVAAALAIGSARVAQPSHIEATA